MARKSKYNLAASPSLPLSVDWIAGFYLRLSVEDGDDEEYNSIGNQRKICMDYLQKHEHIQFGGIYTDNGYTGMNYKRPGFQALLADLQAGKINCIIVKDVSRLGRHYILTSEYVERTFPSMGVRLICINDNYDSEDPHSDRDGLVMPFKLIMNDTYVKDTSKRIRSSITAKMNSRAYLPSASSIPYGYLRDPEFCTYSVDEDAAPIVHRIFEMRAEGMAFNAIARQLNAEGVSCPGKLRYDRGVTKAAKYQDALWIRGTIRKITGDIVYLGNRVHGRVGRHRLGEDKKRRPEDEWQIVSNAHPPIISQELFEKVQEVNRAELERRKSFENRPAPKEDYREALRGKIFCGDCGARMSGYKRTTRKNSKSPNTVFFNCNEYHDSNGQRCSNHYISQDIIIDAVKAFLNQQLKLCVDVESLIAEAHKGSGSRLSGQLLSLRNKKNELEERKLRYLEDLTTGILDRETFLRLKEKNQSELEMVIAQEAAVKAQQERKQEAVSSAETWLAAIRRYQELPKLDRRMVDALVERILVYADRSIRICLTYTDPTALFNVDSESTRGGVLQDG